MRTLATIAILLISGCTTGAVDSNPPQGSNASGASSATEPAETKMAKFGGSYTWDDGITVTVGKPTPYTPSGSAAGTDSGSEAIQFDVTIINKTGKSFDPVGIYLTMQSGNTEASQIYDTANGIEGSPTTTILDGREAKWTSAWSVQDPGDLVLEVTPDQTSSQPAIFTS